MLTVVQAHFEDSQFENNRQDGKRPLKWNAIPTLFSVPNRPKPITVRRINPLQRKRTAAVDMCKPDSMLDSVSSAKRPRTSAADHQYCKSDAQQTVVQSPSCASTDHTYATGSNMSNGNVCFLSYANI